MGICQYYQEQARASCWWSPSAGPASSRRPATLTAHCSASWPLQARKARRRREPPTPAPPPWKWEPMPATWSRRGRTSLADHASSWPPAHRRHPADALALRHCLLRQPSSEQPRRPRSGTSPSPAARSSLGRTQGCRPSWTPCAGSAAAPRRTVASAGFSANRTAPFPGSPLAPKTASPPSFHTAQVSGSRATKSTARCNDFLLQSLRTSLLQGAKS